MIKWLSSPETKIVNWRHFRNTVDTEPAIDGLTEVAMLWANCPKLQRTLFDITSVDNWPDPWELLSQSSYCESSQILGIYYTLQLINDFNKMNPVVEVCAVAGTIQSRIKVGKYYIDLNGKLCVATAPDARLKVIYTLTKPIEN